MNNKKKEEALEIIEAARSYAKVGFPPDAAIVFIVVDEIAEEIVSKRCNFNWQRINDAIEGSLYLNEVDFLINLVSCIKG